MYQAVTAFEPAAHPDFGAAAPGSYELDPGMLARSLDPEGRPVYGQRDAGTATTAGACPSLPCLRASRESGQDHSMEGAGRVVLHEGSSQADPRTLMQSWAHINTVGRGPSVKMLRQSMSWKPAMTGREPRSRTECWVAFSIATAMVLRGFSPRPGGFRGCVLLLKRTNDIAAL